MSISQVNKEYNSNLWFWYFPVADKPVAETPLILWLQGGPGASSLYGLFTEIGPFRVTENSDLEGMMQDKYFSFNLISSETTYE